MTKAKTSTNSNKNKSAEPTEAKQVANPSIEQLSAIRDLLFGEQVKVLEKSLKDQNDALNKRLDNLEALIAKTSSEFTKKLTETSEQITSNLENNRLEHVSQEEILEEKLEVFNGHFGDFQQNTEKEFTQAHNALVETSKEITKSINTEVDKLTNQIETASAELSATKADRKTIANLLESMATNLTESQA